MPTILLQHGHDMKDQTRLVHVRAGRKRTGPVNPPVERGSTLVFATRKELYGTDCPYGRMGLAVQKELTAALCALEGGQYCFLSSNGLQACALALCAMVKAGDHILVCDSIYGPSLRFCMKRLSMMGVSTTRFPPLAGADITGWIRPETKVILLESPGSLTFDIIDTPAIVQAAQAHGLVTIFDNTWGGGIFHRPLDFGIDIVFQSLTKYVTGHADSLGGAVVTRSEKLAEKLKICSEDWGIALAPDEAYSALRGLRTMHTRLTQHEKSALVVAKWLATCKDVFQILHPGLPSHPEHALWQRDFTGTNGLFGFILNTIPESGLDRFLEAMKLFSMGFSWGGYESLLIPCCAQLDRLGDDRIHHRPGPLLRVHVGLEDPDDLIADLDQAFACMSAG